MGTAAKGRIRQNPPVADGGKAPGAICPRHGAYDPPPQAKQLHRIATAPNMDPARARALMDEAGRLRRTCPDCEGICPTPLEWATAIRTQTQTRRSPKPGTAAAPAVFRMPPRHLVDPEACQ